MSVAGNHIIDKVFIQVNTRIEKNAYQIKDHISLFFEEEIFPALEELFNKYNTNGQIIRFDRLDVDFSVEDWNRSEDIKFELLKSVEQQIREAKPAVVRNSVSEDLKIGNKIEASITLQQIVEKEQNYHATFLFFLEYGYLPWFGRQEYITELTSHGKWKESLKHTPFLTALKGLLQKQERAVERFVVQFSDELIFELLAVLNVLQIKDKLKLLSFVQHSEKSFRTCFLKCLVSLSIYSSEKKKCLAELVMFYVSEADDFDLSPESVAKAIDAFTAEMQFYFTRETVMYFFTNSKEEIQNVTDALINIESNIQSGWGPGELANTKLERISMILSDEFVNTENEKEPPFFEMNSTDIVVRNAGLVLFYPFLNTFFKSLTWIAGDGRIKNDKLIKAVQALHFCATGNNHFFEGNLILEKFLCGVPLNTPIPQKSELNNEVKNEATYLLQQVIRNWTALKNTSPDGLRQMFVHRDGKLIQKEKGYKLIVERKVQDILLDKLPWTISIVKLPWKDDLLFVEW